MPDPYASQALIPQHRFRSYRVREPCIHFPVWVEMVCSLDMDGSTRGEGAGLSLQHVLLLGDFTELTSVLWTWGLDKVAAKCLFAPHLVCLVFRRGLGPA